MSTLQSLLHEKKSPQRPLTSSTPHFIGRRDYGINCIIVLIGGYFCNFILGLNLKINA